MDAAQQPKAGGGSPWGMIQSVEHHAEGIVAVSTASHGGLWLSDERMAELPEGYKSYLGTNRWHEEDWDALVLSWFFDLPEPYADEVGKTFDRCEAWHNHMQTLPPQFHCMNGGPDINWPTIKAAKEARHDHVQHRAIL